MPTYYVCRVSSGQAGDRPGAFSVGFGSGARVGEPVWESRRSRAPPLDRAARLFPGAPGEAEQLVPRSLGTALGPGHGVMFRLILRRRTTTLCGAVLFARLKDGLLHGCTCWVPLVLWLWLILWRCVHTEGSRCTGLIVRRTMPSIEPPVHEIAGREETALAATASQHLQVQTSFQAKVVCFISSSSHLPLLAYSTLTFIDGPIWPWRVVTKQTFPALARRAAPRPLIGKGREISELPKESIGPGKKKRALSRHSSLSMPRHHYHRSWPRAPPSHAFTSPSPRAIATTSATALKPLLRHPIRSAV